MCNGVKWHSLLFVYSPLIVYNFFDVMSTNSLFLVKSEITCCFCLIFALYLMIVLYSSFLN